MKRKLPSCEDRMIHDAEESVQRVVRTWKRGRNMTTTFTAIDFETATGYRNSVCQVGLVRVEKGILVERYQSLIRPPGNTYWKKFTDEIHGIGPDDTEGSLSFAESWAFWKHLIVKQTIVAHNLPFDRSCLVTSLECGGLEVPEFQGFCTYRIWGMGLDECCTRLGVSLLNHHDAFADAQACADLFLLAIAQGRVS